MTELCLCLSHYVISIHHRHWIADHKYGFLLCAYVFYVYMYWYVCCMRISSIHEYLRPRSDPLLISHLPIRDIYIYCMQYVQSLKPFGGLVLSKLPMVMKDGECSQRKKLICHDNGRFLWRRFHNRARHSTYFHHRPIASIIWLDCRLILSHFSLLACIYNNFVIMPFIYPALRHPVQCGHHEQSHRGHRTGHDTGQWCMPDLKTRLGHEWPVRVN